MGTNYYRIPTAEEMESRKERLQRDINNMTMSPGDIERGFPFIDPFKESWDTSNPWDIFRDGTSIHLGKRSGGWKFCWNFHKNQYYSNKEQLLSFIRSGRVVDEYGEEWDVEEFIAMALEWGQPDGWVLDEKYEEEHRKKGGHTWGPKYYDLIIDGLRVSTSIEFS